MQLRPRCGWQWLDEMSAVTRQAILDSAAANRLAPEELPRDADQIESWKSETSGLPLTDRLVTVFGGRLQLDARFAKRIAVLVALAESNYEAAGAPYAGGAGLGQAIRNLADP